MGMTASAKRWIGRIDPAGIGSPRSIGSGLLVLAIASASAAQEPPPPTPPEDPPPFGLPESAPPSFSKGFLGKAHVGVSYSCLGVEDSRSDTAVPSAGIVDGIQVPAGASSAFLDATASADLVRGEVAQPRHSAGSRVQANAITLQPFDVCSSTAESVLDAVVAGSHASDPAASGVADVEFRFTFRATLRIAGSGGRFAAYAGTELEALGIDVDGFEVSADGALVQAPPGLTVVDKSPSATNRVYEISGTYTVNGQLLYGPDARNVVKTTFYSGSEVSNTQASARIVRGFAAANALESVRYEIVSLDPNAVFTFVEATAASGSTAQ